MSEKRTVLLVEDEDDIRALLAEALEKEGYHVLTAEHGAHALEEARRGGARIDAVVLDLMMPVMDGRAFVADFRRTHPETPVFVVTASPVESVPQVQRVFFKPLRLSELLEQLRRATVK